MLVIYLYFLIFCNITNYFAIYIIRANLKRFTYSIKSILEWSHDIMSRKRLIGCGTNFANVRNSQSDATSRWQKKNKKQNIHRSLHREALQFDWANVPDNLRNYSFVPRQDESDTSTKFLVGNSGPLLQSFLRSALIKLLNNFWSAKIHAFLLLRLNIIMRRDGEYEIT